MELKQNTDLESGKMFNVNQENKLGVIMQELSKHDNVIQNGYLQGYNIRPGLVDEDGRLHQPNIKPEVLLSTPEIPKYTYPSDVNNQLVPIYQKESDNKNYGCTTCDYKKNIKHFLASNSPSFMENKCTSCYCETETREDIKNYSLIHTIDASVFKDAAKKYVQKRKSTTEGKCFTCDTCFYETKYKYRLNQHVRLMHLDSSAVERVKCTVCEFQTKFKESLKRHMLVHGDPSEIAMHKCSLCMFQTKLKVSLKRHMLIHSDPSEMEMHKCTICVFQTKFKDSLKRHMNTHSPKPVKNSV